MQTMQQKRAKYALDEVKKAAEKLRHKEYKSYASGLPAMIHMNGLGQAAAFYKAKAVTSKEYQHLYDLLSNWLAKEDQPYHGKDLLDGITSMDMQHYRVAQAEAQALMDWVKKFAKAFMTNDASNDGAST